MSTRALAATLLAALLLAPVATAAQGRGPLVSRGGQVTCGSIVVSRVGSLGFCNLTPASASVKVQHTCDNVPRSGQTVEEPGHVCNDSALPAPERTSLDLSIPLPGCPASPTPARSPPPSRGRRRPWSRSSRP